MPTRRAASALLMATTKSSSSRHGWLVVMPTAMRMMRRGLEDKMENFTAKAKDFAGEAGLSETGEGIGKALGELGGEIKLGYERILKAIKD